MPLKGLCESGRFIELTTKAHLIDRIVDPYVGTFVKLGTYLFYTGTAVGTLGQDTVENSLWIGTTLMFSCSLTRKELTSYKLNCGGGVLSTLVKDSRNYI